MLLCRVVCCAMTRVCSLIGLRGARQTRAVRARYELVLYVVCLRLYMCAHSTLVDRVHL